MPELPEVKVHAERLTADFVGRTLTGFRPITFTALKTFDPAPEAGVGAAVTSIGHRAKFLRIDTGDIGYLVHLMQGGRLKPDEKQSAKPRGGIARWLFDDGPALLLTESGTERKAGVWVYRDSPDELEPVARLGPDADTVSIDELAKICGANSKRLHGLLRTQAIIAGLGRRLSNEVCHRAKLSPFANASKLDRPDIESLHAAIVAAVDESVAFEREQDEMVKSKERPGNVHHRTGEPCPVCDDQIREVAYNRYTVNYCATCQTGGKVLADNTTSKFLK